MHYALAVHTGEMHHIVCGQETFLNWYNPELHACLQIKLSLHLLHHHPPEQMNEVSRQMLRCNKSCCACHFVFLNEILLTSVM